MKGLILSKLGMADEANRVFAQAVQIDLNMGKGWAYWGQFNGTPPRSPSRPSNSPPCCRPALPADPRHHPRRQRHQLLPAGRHPLQDHQGPQVWRPHPLAPHL
jgi:hypothetical protein